VKGSKETTTNKKGQKMNKYQMTRQIDLPARCVECGEELTAAWRSVAVGSSRGAWLVDPCSCNISRPIVCSECGDDLETETPEGEIKVSPCGCLDDHHCSHCGQKLEVIWRSDKWIVDPCECLAKEAALNRPQNSHNSPRTELSDLLRVIDGLLLAGRTEQTPGYQLGLIREGLPNVRGRIEKLYNSLPPGGNDE